MMLLALSFVFATPSLLSTAVYAADAAPPGKPEILANLIRGISDGANEQCIANKSQEHLKTEENLESQEKLGSTDAITALCSKITACVAQALNTTQALQSELYDAFSAHLPPEPRYIPLTLAMVKKCHNEILAGDGPKSK